MNTRIATCALVLMLTPTAPTLQGAQPLALSVTPSYAFAPATVRVRVRLDPSADNRALEIVADSAEFYRSSLIQLEGERAPRVVTLDFRSLPEGDYEIRGALFDSMGRERAAICAHTNVIRSGVER